MPYKRYSIILTLLLITMLTLVACERPIPTEDAAESPAGEGDESEGVEPENQPETQPDSPVCMFQCKRSSATSCSNLPSIRTATPSAEFTTLTEWS